MICDVWSKAVAEGSLVPLFRGDKGFSVLINRFVGADVPTDWSLVVFHLYGYFDKTKDPIIPKMCLTSLLTLLKGDAFEVWCAYNVLFFIVCFEKTNRATFYILDDNLISTFKETLTRRQEELKQTKIWEGKSLDEGLWTDIVSSAEVLKKKYKIVLL